MRTNGPQWENRAAGQGARVNGNPDAVGGVALPGLPPDAAAFGPWLRACREALGLTQAALARLLDGKDTEGGGAKGAAKWIGALETGRRQIHRPSTRMAYAHKLRAYARTVQQPPPPSRPPDPRGQPAAGASADPLLRAIYVQSNQFMFLWPDRELAADLVRLALAGREGGRAGAGGVAPRRCRKDRVGAADPVGTGPEGGAGTGPPD